MPDVMELRSSTVGTQPPGKPRDEEGRRSGGVAKHDPPDPESDPLSEEAIVGPGKQDSPDQRQIIITASYFEGPIPAPEVLERLNQVVPGSAKKVIENWLDQSANRRSNENKVIQSNIEARKLGMILGAILAGMGIAGGTLVASLGHPHSGAAMAGASALALATSFLRALFDQRKEMGQKRERAEKIKRSTRSATGN